MPEGMGAPHSEHLFDDFCWISFEFFAPFSLEKVKGVDIVFSAPFVSKIIPIIKIKLAK